jgi:hypothetical protein
MLEEDRIRMLSWIHREIDSGSYQSHKLEKSSSNINYAVDPVLAKNYRRKINGQAKKHSFPWKQVLTVVLALFVVLAAVPYVLPPLFGDFGSDVSISISPDVIFVNDSVFVNVSIPVVYNISSVSADMAGVETIDLMFVDNSSLFDLWSGNWVFHDLLPGEHVVTINAFDVNNTFYSAGARFSVLTKETIEENDPAIFTILNLTLQSDKQFYVVNETVLISGIVLFNNSLINTSADLFITGPNVGLTVPINVSDGIFEHKFIPIYAGRYSVNVYVKYLNEYIEEEIVFDVTSFSLNNDSFVSIVDSKRDESVFALPGTSFYIERTIDGSIGSDVVFAPMFSNALTIDKIEIFNDQDSIEERLKISEDVSPNAFTAGKAKLGIEHKIDDLRNSQLFNLKGPVTIRVWFEAPSWEEIISGNKPSSGHISYLLFSDDASDFEGSTWWNSNWGYRKLININSSQVVADLTNFPVLINITDTDLRDNAQDDGDDIAFVLYIDNTTQLNHEIELFNDTTGELVSWVNITSLSSSDDTKIWMYYNNSAASNQQNVIGTWDSNYLLVHHLEEDDIDGGTGDIKDSTSYGYNGTTSGMDTSDQISGNIDGSFDFDGTNDYVSLGTTQIIDGRDVFTIEAWVNPDTNPGTNDVHEVWIRRDSGSTGCFNFAVGTYSAADTYIAVTTNNGGWNTHSSNTEISLQTWSHIAAYYDGTSTLYYYLNGSSDGTDSFTEPSVVANLPQYIGVAYPTTQNFDGTIDELRISNIERNSSWIKTGYNNQINQSTFISIGSEEYNTNTSVNTISPYTVTYSPYTITVTGATGLTNVTFYYRFSTDNSSWGSNVSWNNNSNPDTLSPWEWNFDFSNGTGYYEFYSIGKKSGFTDETAPDVADAICYFNESLNTLPEITLISPSPNGTTGVNQQPNCQIWANDSDGDTLTVYWYENSTGGWVLSNTNSSISADSIVSYNFTEFSNYSVTYWWKVAINDSTDNISEWFYFTTKPILTSVDKIDPYNQSTFSLTINSTGNTDLDNISLYYRWSNDNISWDVSFKNWWNSNWGKRKLITVNSSQINTDLTNFPMLVYRSSDSDLSNSAQSDGDDIKFILYSDNTTHLNHEIGLYNNTTGELAAWLNITSLSSIVDTKIWMYYNNSACSSQENVSGTWDSNYEIIWHLQENGNGTTDEYIDSSSNSCHGTGGKDDDSGWLGDATETPDRVSGKFGYAQDFNVDGATGDRISSQNLSSAWSAVTGSIWIYGNAAGDDRLWGKSWGGGTTDNTILMRCIGTGASTLGCRFRTDTSSTTGYEPASMENNQWIYMVLTWDGSDDYTVRIYKNGVLQGSGLTVSGSTLYGSPPHEFFTLGNVGDGATNRCFDGYIQEARMSSIRRNISWINTEYNNQNNLTTFLNFENEETYTEEDTWNYYGTDLASPWNWNFNFPNGTGYYEFYSIGKKSNEPDENPPTSADAHCYNNPYTIVDPISPYNQTTSPITITANGTSGFDNVTLYYRYSTDNSSWDNGSIGISWSSELVTNGGFESGDFTGWTTYSDQSGDWGVDNGEPLYGTHGAQEGSYSAYHSQVSGPNCYVRQDVDVTSYASDIDTGKCVVNASGWYVSDEYDASIYDISRVRIQFLNASKGVISTPTDSGFDNVNVWTQESISNYDVPTNTRYIRMEGFTYETNWDSGSVDNFSVSIGTEEDGDWNKFGTDTESPWSWNFNFPNGTGYYEFYSVGNKSGWQNETKPDNADAICKYNTLPTITNEGPSNGSTNVPLTPQMNITINDAHGDTMTLTWYSNSSGSWQIFGTNSSVNNGTYHQTNSNYTHTGKTYWWYVTVNDGLDTNTSSTFHFTTTQTAPPQVTTNSSSGVEENNATLRGYLYDEGGESCTGRFEYGTTTSYGTNTTNQTISEGQEFSAGINSLTSGQLYHYRAFANNTYGSDTGIDNMFLTKPQSPTSLVAQMNNSNIIYLTWITGTGSNTTFIERNTTNNWPLGEGTQVYNGTVSIYEDSGLTQGTTYYYQAWSYTNWTAGGSTLHQWSDDNASANNKTNNNPTIDVISPTNGSTGLTFQPTCQIWANDTDGDTLSVFWYENSTESWILRQTNNSVTANSTVSWTFSQANNYGINYYWKVAINDSRDNTTNWFYFTTETLNTSVNTISPYEVVTSPLTITATNNTPVDNVTLYYRWSNDNITWGPTYDTITIDTTSSSTGGSVSSISWSHTVGNGDNRILVACSGVEDSQISDYIITGADFNGKSLTKANSTFLRSGNNYLTSTEIWYILNPNIGTYTMRINYTGTVDDCSVGTISLFNVSQQGPEAFNSSTNEGPNQISTTIATSLDGSIVIDVAHCGNAQSFTQGSGQNEFFDETAASSGSAGSYKLLPNAGTTTMWENVSSANRLSHVVATWVPSSSMINCSNWAVWNDATNPDTESPWSWNFNFPNSTGYYEFYSIGKKSDSSDEIAPITADAICHWIENTTINVTPSQWNQGDVLMGTSNATTGFYFNLSHEGNLQVNVLIKASNATNISTGSEWKLNNTPGHNNFSVQYNKSGGGTWTNINTTFDTFVTSLNIDAWQTFDLNLIMATSTSKNDPLSFTITFKSVVA